MQIKRTEERIKQITQELIELTAEVAPETAAIVEELQNGGFAINDGGVGSYVVLRGCDGAEDRLEIGNSFQGRLELPFSGIAQATARENGFDLELRPEQGDGMGPSLLAARRLRVTTKVAFPNANERLARMINESCGTTRGTPSLACHIWNLRIEAVE